MTINQSKIPESHKRLMEAIGQAIQLHTLTTPMSAEDVIGILSFCAGAAVANGKSPHSKRELRSLAVQNIDNAIAVFAAQPASGLILPN